MMKRVSRNLKFNLAKEKPAKELMKILTTTTTTVTLKELKKYNNQFPLVRASL
jgi:hypothetical protein